MRNTFNEDRAGKPGAVVRILDLDPLCSVCLILEDKYFSSMKKKRLERKLKKTADNSNSSTLLPFTYMCT